MRTVEEIAAPWRILRLMEIHGLRVVPGPSGRPGRELITLRQEPKTETIAGRKAQRKAHSVAPDQLPLLCSRYFLQVFKLLGEGQFGSRRHESNPRSRRDQLELHNAGETEANQCPLFRLENLAAVNQFKRIGVVEL